MSTHRLDVAALWERLDKQRAARGLMWQDVAAELQISASTLTRLGQGKRPDADALVSMFVWLDMDTDIVYVIRPQEAL